MIGERHVTPGVVLPRAASRVNRAALLGPAVAGRVRLAEALGESPVVQLMLALAFVALAGLLYLMQASQVSDLQINIGELQSERTALVSQTAALQATATRLQAPARIEAVATQQLHMVRPDLSTAIWVRPVVPLVSPSNIANRTDNAIAESQPLAWMARTLTYIRASL